MKKLFIISMLIMVVISLIFPVESASLSNTVMGGVTLMGAAAIADINKNGVIIELSSCTAEAIYDQFDDSHVAHISQKVVSKYPNRKFGNRLSTGLFTNSKDDYKIFENVRHTLVKVPNDLLSKNKKHLEVVQKQLDSFKGTIQRIVSNTLSDVLTEGDNWRVSEGLTTMEELADRYETRDSENNKYSAGELRMSSEGEVVNALLPREYSRRVYQSIFKADQDLRSVAGVGSDQHEDMGAEVIDAKNGVLVP